MPPTQGPPLHARKGRPAGANKRKRTFEIQEATDPSLKPTIVLAEEESATAPDIPLVKIEDEDEPSLSAPPEPRRGPKGGKKAKLQKSTSAVEPVKCVIEWPPYFKSLETTHRALNLVFTFCCTRKHLVTTFATIQSAVESHTKRTL